MPKGFWKICGRLTAILLGLIAFAYAMYWAAYAIEGATGIWSGWVMLAFLAVYTMAGIAVGAYQITKETPPMLDEWKRFEGAWTPGFIAWRHVTGAVIWKFDDSDDPDDPGDRGWAYASNSASPTHGDTEPSVGASYPPNAASIDEAKRLALALRKETP